MNRLLFVDNLKVAKEFFASTTSRAIYSVLLSDVNNQEFAVRVLINLGEPTGPMKTEAAEPRKFATIYGDYPKLRLLTIRELVAGGKVLYRHRAAETFKTAVIGGKKYESIIRLGLQLKCKPTATSGRLAFSA